MATAQWLGGWWIDPNAIHAPFNDLEGANARSTLGDPLANELETTFWRNGELEPDWLSEFAQEWLIRSPRCHQSNALTDSLQPEADQLWASLFRPDERLVQTGVSQSQMEEKGIRPRVATNHTPDEARGVEPSRP